MVHNLKEVVMLRPLRHSVTFPNLVHKDDVHFKSWSGGSKSKTTPVYKLDWEKKEKLHKKRHEEWNKQCWPTKNIPYPKELPEKYDVWLKKLEFCIPHHYMREIHRTSQHALLEWGMERHFDTSIREMCLKAAESFVYIAFNLIADCVYDRKKNGFYRGDDKMIVSNMLIYKFWVHQTGRGLLWFKSGLDRWERRFGEKTGRLGKDEKEERNMIGTLLKDMEEHREYMDKCYEKMYLDKDGNWPKTEGEVEKPSKRKRKVEPKSKPVTEWVKGVDY